VKRIPLEVRRRSYRGWPDSWHVTNGLITVVAVADIGPRILHAGFVDGPNLFRVFDETAGRTGGDQWTMYGGHRLWHAPEDKERTYVPDNAPVRVEEIAGGIQMTQRREPGTGIRKQMTIQMHPFRTTVCVTHRLTNEANSPLEVAPWALSVMERGGFAIAPLPVARHPDGLLPNRCLTLWPYTDLRDSRLLLGRDHVLLRHQAGRPPLKIGLRNPEGWLAYSMEEFLFVKRFGHEAGARYPDFDSSSEIYSNSEMLELESLGPLTVLEPGSEVLHHEAWEFHRGIRVAFSEEDVRGKLASVTGKSSNPSPRESSLHAAEI
jgi:hypothetical protein